MNVKKVEKEKDGLSMPKKEGDVGFDLTSHSVKAKGKGYNNNKELVTEFEGDIKDLNGIAWLSLDYIQYETGVKIQPEDKNVFSLVIPNSRVTKENLILANSVGVIDTGYNGEILVRYKYFFQPQDLRGNCFDGSCPFVGYIDIDKIFKVGDVVAQLVFANSLIPNLQVVKTLNETKRGKDGFGSTKR